MGCFLIQDQNLRVIPDILTYSVVIYTAGTDFMRAFYCHFGEFSRLRKYLEDKLTPEHKRIEELLYSYIRIEYSSMIRKHRNGQLGLFVLDYLNDAVCLIAKYAGTSLLLSQQLQEIFSFLYGGILSCN